ncbi:sporulation histidine kinase inhibitor Sda [Bacillus pinisoli]|nr:sporulation histidine kinase inhibitor Sda [Bacillus pinisoli]
MKITDQELIEAYQSAVELALDHEFITMLAEELEKRGLSSKVKLRMVQK